MVKVELTPQQAVELQNYYINELDRLQKRSKELLNLLKAIDQEPAAPRETALETTPEPEQKSAEKKPAATPRWSEYILKLLNEREKGVTNNQIFKAYQKEFNVEFPNPNAVKNTLGQALHYLQNKNHLIEGIPRKGKRGNVYKLVKENDKPATKEKKLPKPKKEKTQKKKPIEIPATDAPDPKLIQFIADKLKEEKEILNRDEFVNYTMIHFNRPAKHKISTRGKVSKALSYMVKETDQLQKTKKEGQRGTYFGLKEWFDEDKNLLPDYK